jgi:hypothetical protein
VNAISPDEGQKLLAVAITEPHAALNARDVSTLPMTPSPELDNLLITKLEGRRTEEMKAAAPLVGKFATAAILDRVRAVYEVESEAWPCDIEAGLLAYFLRVDSDYGVKMLPAALAFAASRSQLTCQRPTLIGAISVLYYSPVIEQAAIAQLDAPNPRMAFDAVETLRQHMSGPALAALLDRFRRFHDEWKDFDPQKSGDDSRKKWDSTNQSSLEMALVRALSQSQSYRRIPDKLEALAKLCVTDACRAEAARMAR